MAGVGAGAGLAVPGLAGETSVLGELLGGDGGLGLAVAEKILDDRDRQLVDGRPVDGLLSWFSVFSLSRNNC